VSLFFFLNKLLLNEQHNGAHVLTSEQCLHYLHSYTPLVLRAMLVSVEACSREIQASYVKRN